MDKIGDKMKIVDIKRTYQGKYLSYYLVYYHLSDGTLKEYEMVSRDHNLTIDKVGNGDIKGVGLVIFSLDKSQVLLQKEFRLATNKWIVTFPAGLIDQGETPTDASIRELKEETGLDLVEVIDILPPCFTCQGFCDELMTIVIATASGKIIPSNDPSEEILPKWYTKEEVKKLFQENAYMSVRTQMFLWQWVNN